MCGSLARGIAYLHNKKHGIDPWLCISRPTGMGAERPPVNVGYEPFLLMKQRGEQRLRS
jgi:hypothetical protein